jgi:excisionase family DNA binding protein
MDLLHDFGLLTLKQVAALLHCSKAHVCKAVRGRIHGCPPIPAVSLGRRKLVRRETLLTWIERNEQAADVIMPTSPKRGAGKRAQGAIENAHTVPER